MADRRLPHGLSLAFDGNLDRVEEWLEANCVGTFDFEFEGMKENQEGFDQLRVLFRFERKEDKERFKQVVMDGLFTSY